MNADRWEYWLLAGVFIGVMVGFYLRMDSDHRRIFRFVVLIIAILKIVWEIWPQ